MKKKKIKNFNLRLLVRDTEMFPVLKDPIKLKSIFVALPESTRILDTNIFKMYLFYQRTNLSTQKF